MWTTFGFNNTALYGISQLKNKIIKGHYLVWTIFCGLSLVYAEKPWKRIFWALLLACGPNRCKNWASWLEFIRASRGGHLPEIIFKT